MSTVHLDTLGIIHNSTCIADIKSLIFTQSKIFQDLADETTLIEKADDFHLAAALGTGQRKKPRRVNF